MADVPASDDGVPTGSIQLLSVRVDADGGDSRTIQLLLVVSYDEGDGDLLLGRTVHHPRPRSSSLRHSLGYTPISVIQRVGEKTPLVLPRCVLNRIIHYGVGH